MNKLLQTKWILGPAFVVGAVLLMSTQYASASSALFGGASETGGHVVLVSDTSNASTSDDYSGINYDDANGTVFSTLSDLEADYDVTNDSCGGGSPRFVIDMDTNGDGISDGAISVYLGPSPSFTGCTGAASTGNLIGNNDAGRWDFTQLAPGVYGYNNAPASVMNGTILGISLVVDGSWSAAATGGDSEQTVNVDNIKINNQTYTYPQTVHVTIVKRIDGNAASSTSANGAAFPMTATWNDPAGIGAGTGSFSLTASTNPAYEAQTTDLQQGADYSASEDTSSSVVGPDCSAGHAYRLVGYSSGDSRAAALAATTTSNAPLLTNIQTDKFVMVWNATCLQAPTPISPANGSATTTAGQTMVDWTDTASNAGGVTYTYQASNAALTNIDGSFTTPVYTSAPLATSSIATPGTPDGTYYWHAMAMDAYNNTSPWSTTWSFTVNNNSATTTPATTTEMVHIAKYINGALATAQSASSTSFTMNAAWTDSQIGTGSGTYTLGAPSYKADTVALQNGSDYGTSEVTGTNVGSSCAAGLPYALDGYSTGSTMQAAASSTVSSTSPSFTNLQHDQYVIVWNKTCANGTIGGTVGTPGVLAVTSIDAVDTSATAGNTYGNGWKYIFHVTLPTNETGLAMKFSDWMSSTGSSTFAVANNMRISSAQANNGGAAITILAANTYTTPDLQMVTDLDPSTPGIQVDVTVEVKIPVGTANASYTNNYGVRSE